MLYTVYLHRAHILTGYLKLRVKCLPEILK